MKYTWLALGLLLVSCTAPVNEWTVKSADLTTIPGLKDCSYHKVYTGERSLHVIRCPNSTVANNYQVGKAADSVTTVDQTIPTDVESAPVTELYKCSTDGDGVLTCTKAQ